MRANLLRFAADLLELASKPESRVAKHQVMIPDYLTPEDLEALARAVNVHNFRGPTPATAREDDVCTPENLSSYDAGSIMAALAEALHEHALVQSAVRLGVERLGGSRG